MKILKNIPFKLDTEAILKQLHLRNENKQLEKNIRELIKTALSIAKPKALYRISYIENKNENSLYIDGVKFTSRILRINLDKIERVFPYVATCGKELDEISISPDDIMLSYSLDIIKEMILRSAHNYLKDYITKNYKTAQLSQMHPGSLEDWHITQQKKLFSIFGNVEELIGVKLTESFLMTPVKSLSGMFFPTEIKFESCRLCPREVCIRRAAPYEPELVKKYLEKDLK